VYYFVSIVCEYSLHERKPVRILWLSANYVLVVRDCNTFNFHTLDGTTGNLKTGVYVLPNGEQGNLYTGPYPSYTSGAAASTSYSTIPTPMSSVLEQTLDPSTAQTATVMSKSSSIPNSQQSAGLSSGQGELRCSTHLHFKEVTSQTNAPKSIILALKDMILTQHSKSLKYTYYEQWDWDCRIHNSNNHGS